MSPLSYPPGAPEDARRVRTLGVTAAMDEDVDALLLAEDHLTDEALCELAGVDSLDEVRALSLVVDASVVSSALADIGERATHLDRLRVSGSTLSSMRDLGTAYRQLQVIWISRCGLCDVDGIHALPALREVFASFNDITELSPFAFVEKLAVLDLEANKVADVAQVQFLTPCTELVDVTLAHNPVAAVAGYWEAVVRAVPGAITVDDVAIMRPLGHVQGPTTPTRRELSLICDGVKYASVELVTLSTDDGPSRPGTAPRGAGRPKL